MKKFNKLMQEIKSQIDLHDRYIMFELNIWHRSSIYPLLDYIYTSGYHLVTVQDFLTITKMFIFEKDKVSK